MSYSPNSSLSPADAKPVYGFMDTATNTFYAFQSEADYKLFLALISQQQENASALPDRDPLNEDQLRANEELAT